MTLYIGIDNGLNGGIAVIDDNENIVEKTAMPTMYDNDKSIKTYDIQKIRNVFNKIQYKYDNQDKYVVLEKCHTMPINGAKANFTNGYNYGAIQSILTLLGFDYDIVLAKTWQKEIFKNINARDTKDASVNFCLCKYPNEDFKATDRCKKYHDGMTDALCMAIYCKRIRERQNKNE